VGLPRGVGWAGLGLAAGSAEGLVDRSARKLRNGLIGGGIGGVRGHAQNPVRPPAARNKLSKVARCGRVRYIDTNRGKDPPF